MIFLTAGRYIPILDKGILGQAGMDGEDIESNKVGLPSKLQTWL